MNLLELKKTLDSEAGKELKNFLIDEILKLRDISNLRDYDTPTAQSIELKAQRKALEKLKVILNKVISFQDIDTTDREKDQFFA
jgi:hypothetical protein